MCLMTHFIYGKKKFDSGLEWIEKASKSGRRKSASCDEIASKVKDIVYST